MYVCMYVCMYVYVVCIVYTQEEELNPFFPPILSVCLCVCLSKQRVSSCPSRLLACWLWSRSLSKSSPPMDSFWTTRMSLNNVLSTSYPSADLLLSLYIVSEMLFFSAVLLFMKAPPFVQASILAPQISFLNGSFST